MNNSIHSDYYFMPMDLQLFAKEGMGGERTEPATPKKIEDAKKKGNVAKSVDVPSAVSILVFFVLLKILVGITGNGFMEEFHKVINSINSFIHDDFNYQRAADLINEGILDVLRIAAPYLLVIYLVVLISMFMQVRINISYEPLKPKLNKISPLSGFKRFFSLQKLMDVAKSTLKVLILGIVIYSYIKDKLVEIEHIYALTIPEALAFIGDMIVSVGLRIALWFCVIAAADFIFQKWKYKEDLKMSKQEIKEEYKNTEGDPVIKGQQRQRMQEASRRRMMNAVPEADVVITNPTHIAVALKYDRERSDAPIVTAKGEDYLAQKIKEKARESGVEIVENKPVARMLYHNVEIGREIPPELYKAVAEILAYVYQVKGKI
ncbi:MAG: flagellar biosynthesis protein FlhB [Lachnospiraceae bacterium]|jgi:flagellar biosynthetic protein FlhB|nr:flagellar biosynthesis protein FlhB [Lachnospiraceae bacterium]MEE3460439.1 flagellar biosynthesis protein FlhB [Lachnospiraceae bacterium]